MKDQQYLTLAHLAYLSRS